MDRWALALLLGIVGGAAGGLGVRYLVPEPSGHEAATASDDAAFRALKEEIAALAQKVDRRDARPSLVAPPGRGAAGGAGLEPTRGSGSLASLPMSREEVEALVARVAEAAATSAVEKHSAKQEASRPPEKKKVTVAELGRELGLSASQEDDIRRAYTDAGEKYLKLMAEPDGSVDDVRREVEAAKDDEGKKTGLMMKYLPKIMGKLPEMMTIEAEKSTRIHKAVGTENAKKLDGYRIAEDDAFGIGTALSVQATDDK